MLVIGFVLKLDNAYELRRILLLPVVKLEPPEKDF